MPSREKQATPRFLRAAGLKAMIGKKGLHWKAAQKYLQLSAPQQQ